VSLGNTAFGKRIRREQQRGIKKVRFPAIFDLKELYRMSKKKRPTLRTVLIFLGVIIAISVIANMADSGDISSGHSNSIATDVTVVIPTENSEKNEPRQSDSATLIETDTSKEIVPDGNLYKFITDKTDSEGLVTNKVEIYVADDRNYKRMYEFIKSRKISSNTMYHAHFFDDEKYAVLPEGGARSLYWDNENMEHIIAEYTRNTINDFVEFVFYEENKYESSPKHF
jgi:hypothetical protein